MIMERTSLCESSVPFAKSIHQIGLYLAAGNAIMVTWLFWAMSFVHHAAPAQVHYLLINKVMLSSDIDYQAVSAQQAKFRLAELPRNCFQPSACHLLARQPMVATSMAQSSKSPTMEAWGPLAPSHHGLSPQSHQMLQDLEGYCHLCSAPSDDTMCICYEAPYQGMSTGADAKCPRMQNRLRITLHGRCQQMNPFSTTRFHSSCPSMFSIVCASAGSIVCFN